MKVKELYNICGNDRSFRIFTVDLANNIIDGRIDKLSNFPNEILESNIQYIYPEYIYIGVVTDFVGQFGFGTDFANKLYIK